VLQRKDGGEISWGTADETWGAAITDANGEYVSSIETTCPSDSQDIAAVAAALHGRQSRVAPLLDNRSSHLRPQVAEKVLLMLPYALTTGITSRRLLTLWTG